MGKHTNSRTILNLGTATALAACCWLAQTGMAFSERLLVGVDRAQIVRVDVPVDTVIIGNPTIADASVYDQTTLIITGKAFGETNLIVMDSLGKVIHEADVSVATPPNTVTMHKGATRLSYTCAPVCERTLRPGDGAEDFTNLQTQVTSTLELGARPGEAVTAPVSKALASFKDCPPAPEAFRNCLALILASIRNRRVAARERAQFAPQRYWPNW